MTDIERLQRLTGEKDSGLVEILLEDAGEFVLAYTGRKRMIPQLEKAVRDLAVIALNRLGAEGEKARNAGGVNASFENAPKQIYGVLDRYRLACVGGRTYETEKKQAETVLSAAGGNEEGT